MANFADEVKKQLDGFVADAEHTATLAFREVVKKAYDHLMSPGVSPVWSGYYKTNHRINIKNAKGQFKTGGVKLFPTTKPEFPEIFIYLGNVERVRSTELAKLAKLELGDFVQIDNIVPYADIVELMHRPYANTEAIIRASR